MCLSLANSRCDVQEKYLTDTCAQYHLKVSQMDAIPRLRYHLGNVLRDVLGYPKLVSHLPRQWTAICSFDSLSPSDSWDFPRRIGFLLFLRFSVQCTGENLESRAHSKQELCTKS